MSIPIVLKRIRILESIITFPIIEISKGPVAVRASRRYKRNIFTAYSTKGNYPISSYLIVDEQFEQCPGYSKYYQDSRRFANNRICSLTNVFYASCFYPDVGRTASGPWYIPCQLPVCYHAHLSKEFDRNGGGEQSSLSLR